jgi:hypothetical protein
MAAGDLLVARLAFAEGKWKKRTDRQSDCVAREGKESLTDDEGGRVEQLAADQQKDTEKRRGGRGAKDQAHTAQYR